MLCRDCVRETCRKIVVLECLRRRVRVWLDGVVIADGVVMPPIECVGETCASN